MLTAQELRLLYGPDAILSRTDKFVLVHMDKPDAALVEKRTVEFDPETFFDRDCHICALTKQGGVVVFDDSLSGL